MAAVWTVGVVRGWVVGGGWVGLVIGWVGFAFIRHPPGQRMARSGHYPQEGGVDGWVPRSRPMLRRVNASASSTRRFGGKGKRHAARSMPPNEAEPV